MIHFILNQNNIAATVPPGMLLLDFIRYRQNLTGTKIGCREGDCGACTILIGELKNGVLTYSSATSCLMAMGNAAGKHIVTIEGINGSGLNAVQQAFAEEGATQCGFCTPGFVVSLAGFCMSSKEPSYEAAIDSMNGNICRCTGYKSIERAAKKISHTLQERKGHPHLRYAIDNGIIPSYFEGIADRLAALPKSELQATADTGPQRFLGGGTDLYVQQHDGMMEENIRFLLDQEALRFIRQESDRCIVGGTSTVTDIAGSPVFQKHFPDLQAYIKLISSTQIRNMATIAGNFTNASPIGDLTIFFLALDATLVLSDGATERTIPLRKFYKGYKQLDRSANEIIRELSFELPSDTGLFNFEKVCKRTWLDIASVNAAISLTMKEDTIAAAGLSAGGVGPVPMYLSKSSEYLKGKRITADLINELAEIVQTEISPISDARGSEAYKRLLLSQLIRAHFIRLFPGLPLLKLMQHS